MDHANLDVEPVANLLASLTVGFPERTFVQWGALSQGGQDLSPQIVEAAQLGTGLAGGDPVIGGAGKHQKGEKEAQSDGGFF